MSGKETEKRELQKEELENAVGASVDMYDFMNIGMANHTCPECGANGMPDAKELAHMIQALGFYCPRCECFWYSDRYHGRVQVVRHGHNYNGDRVIKECGIGDVLKVLWNKWF